MTKGNKVKAKITIVMEYDTEDLSFMMGEEVNDGNFLEVINDRIIEDILDAYRQGGVDALATKIKLTESEKMSEIKYPDVKVTLVGNDGNAFAIMGAVQKALRKAGVSQEELNEYYKESTSGDYDHLIQTAMRWVKVS
jgi:hypothetical protein